MAIPQALAGGENVRLRAMVLLWDERSQISHWIDLHHRCRSVESLKRRLRRGAKQGHWTGWRVITIEQEGGV